MSVLPLIACVCTIPDFHSFTSYWDNVGGYQLDSALANAALHARFIVSAHGSLILWFTDNPSSVQECGMASGYHADTPALKNMS